jgi:hypothetical protein
MTNAPTEQVSDLVALIVIVLFGTAILELGPILTFLTGDYQ